MCHATSCVCQTTSTPSYLTVRVTLTQSLEGICGCVELFIAGPFQRQEENFPSGFSKNCEPRQFPTERFASGI
jgi:hypothetical protein